MLTEEFAALGCQVTGIDISPKSIAVAQAHASISGLDIDYQVGSGFSCLATIEGYPESFGSLEPPYFSNKKAARQQGPFRDMSATFDALKRRVRELATEHPSQETVNENAD